MKKGGNKTTVRLAFASNWGMAWLRGNNSGQALRLHSVRHGSPQAGQALRLHSVRHGSPQAGQALRLHSGQAAILIIFVLGMVTLLIGMSLSQTGFRESMMARGTAGSTKAFYVANSGIEDAIYRMKNSDMHDDSYELSVEEGKATVSVTQLPEESEDGVITLVSEITSVGEYKNYVRKIRAVVKNEVFAPDFTRFIQAGRGGIEIDDNVEIRGYDYINGKDVMVNVYSNNFIRGKNNGIDGKESCDEPVATTQIAGNVTAFGVVEGLGNGSGPCIDGDVFAESLKECRVYGTAFSGSGEYGILCPYKELCNPADKVCQMPEKQPLPEGIERIVDYIMDNGGEYDGDCIVGDPSTPCWTPAADGTPTLGNIVINGDLKTYSNSSMYLSGSVYVAGNVEFNSNQTIGLDPSVDQSTSLIFLANGTLTVEANVNFTSIDTTFLLMASQKHNGTDDPETVCDDDNDEIAITINPNVQSILFYAIHGCAWVRETAGKAFRGAIIAEGIKIDNNVEMIYDTRLQNARFYFNEGGAFTISSFAEI